VVPAPPAIPKPFQPGTATATFLGRTIARWREGDGQWFYDNGSAVQGIKDAPYNNLGLFDWPPAYDTTPEGVTGALQTLKSSQTEDFRLATDGRLSIFSSDGTVWTTTSLQSLDVQNAQYYLGFLTIPCRTDHQHCVYRNTSGLSDTLLIWVDNAAASKTALDAMRELKKLFGDPIRVVREDANCSCLRYDVDAARPEPLTPATLPTAERRASGNATSAVAGAGDNQDTVNRGSRETVSSLDKSSFAAFVPLIILAFAGLWALRSRVKSGS
jgi:hypothetical protein